MLDWYVVKLKPRNERGVEAALQVLGVECYVPKIVALKGGRLSSENLFPGYAFVQVDTGSESWRRARWTHGISYFLPAQRQPAAVGEALVGDIRSRVEQWNAGDWITAFNAGDRVRIEAGSLRGLDAIFRRYLPGRIRMRRNL